MPKDDRYSVSLKEYLAEIDVCMGGRVAEELGALFYDPVLIFSHLTTARFVFSVRTRERD